MSRIIYVNGAYYPYDAAKVHVDDRGYQFADGVYEVIPFIREYWIELDQHLERLSRSASEIGISLPVTPQVFPFLIRELIHRNRVKTGIIYIQVTRGVAPRAHIFPQEVQPGLVITVRPYSLPLNARVLNGAPVLSIPDSRWQKVYIKSLSLLPNVLAKQYAYQKGAFEGWFVNERGEVTEGTASNAWIVTKRGEILTPPVGHKILAGITRARVLYLCHQEALNVKEQIFTLEEAYQASEAFLTSSTAFVKPIIQIDGHVLGDGQPGPLTKEVAKLYCNFVQKEIHP